MKIIYTGIQYSFYKKSYGLSFEHNNFYLSLKNMPGVEVIYLPFDRILEVGKKRFNEELKEAIDREQPDLLFVFMLTDEVNMELLDEIRKKGKMKTLAWFSDDTWRYYSYSKQWAAHFDWTVTVYAQPYQWYLRDGFKNVIYSQWAANVKLYRPANTSRKTDVSFIGSWNKERGRIVADLVKKGVPVSSFGAGWKTGRLSENDMIRLFYESKVNLGINSPNADFSIKSIGKLFFRRSVEKIVPDFWHFPRNFRSWLVGRKISQIKARIFEIPACGGFLLTGKADDLDKFFEIGKEIAVYEKPEDIPKIVRYYLSHNEERERMAKAGYERVIRDHTYEKRLEEIFKKIGLENAHGNE